jgi:hypothetical protein
MDGRLIFLHHVRRFEVRRDAFWKVIGVSEYPVPQGRGHIRFRSHWKESQEKPKEGMVTSDCAWSDLGSAAGSGRASVPFWSGAWFVVVSGGALLPAGIFFKACQHRFAAIKSAGESSSEGSSGRACLVSDAL